MNQRISRIRMLRFVDAARLRDIGQESAVNG
jgi:hypothetical protein